MSAEYAVQLKDLFTASADKVADSAERVHQAIKGAQDAAGRGFRLGGQSGGGRGGASDWDRVAAAAQRAADKEERLRQRGAASAARLRQRQDRDEQRAAANKLRDEQRFSAYRIRLDRREAAEKVRAARQAERETDRAARKPWFGGQKSVGGLLRHRAAGKISGLATGAADAALSAPGRIVGGLFGGIGTAVSGAADMALSLGRAAISAQAMREDSVEGFKAIFGSADKANELFDAARAAAKQTKFDTDEVVRDFNTLAAGGFAYGDIKNVYWSSADIGSARGKGRQERYINALSKINASPQASFGNVQQAALAGPGLGNVLDQLGQRLGLRQTLTRKGWMDLFRSGKVSSKVAMESVIGATNALYNKKTGQAGEYAKGQGGDTWSGLLSNIHNGIGDVLNMRLPKDHAINSFKNILKEIGDSEHGLFSGTKSAIGRRFEKLVGRFVEDVFMPIGGLTDSKTSSLLGKLIEGGELLEKKFREVMTEITKGVNDWLKGSGGALIGLAEDIGVAIARGIAKALPGGRYSSFAQGSSEKAWGNLLSDVTDFGGGSAPAAGSKFFAGDLTSGAPGGSHAAGGRIPGPFGKPILTMMHGGEIVPGLHGEHMGEVLARYRPAQFGAGGSSSAGSGINVSISCPITVMAASSASELVQEAAPMLAAVARQEVTAALGSVYAGGGLG